MKKIIAVIFTFITFFTTSQIANASEYELHHIFPQENFRSLGDDYTIAVTYFEHKWITHGDGFHTDWDKRTKPSLQHGLIKGDIIVDGNISNYAQRQAALIAGQRILSYQLFTVRYSNDQNAQDARKNGPNYSNSSHLLASSFDLCGNVLYNVSYVLSMPAKIIHFWIYTIGHWHPEYNLLGLIWWTLYEVVVGVCLAIIMLFVGSAIGIVCHPMWSIGGLVMSMENYYTVNLITTIYNLLDAWFGSLWIILFW